MRSARSACRKPSRSGTSTTTAISTWPSPTKAAIPWSILLGNGDGTFQPQIDVPVGSEPTSIVAGDFNGDGRTDLAVTNFGSGTVSILLGDGDGTFQPQATYAVGGTLGRRGWTRSTRTPPSSGRTRSWPGISTATRRDRPGRRQLGRHRRGHLGGRDHRAPRAVDPCWAEGTAPSRPRSSSRLSGPPLRDDHQHPGRGDR